MSDIKIEYDSKAGRFLISSPPWSVARMRALPNRRWDTKRKVWTAPAIRMNARHIRDHMHDAQLSAEAKNALARALTGVTVNDGQLLPPHYSYATKPYDHQKTGLEKVFSCSTFALFMEMRTGKSKVTIDYAAAHHMAGNVDSVVIVCPYSIRRNWEDEIRTHSPYEASTCVLDTSKPKKFDAWINTPHPFRWLVVGVESLGAGSAGNYVERFLLTTTKGFMAVDESHKIKSPSANRSQECVRLGKMAERRAILTGTSVANSPLDLFMQFEFLDPNIVGVGDYYSFRNRYAIMGGYEDKQIIGYQNMPELMEIISPFVYQVARKDVFDLPPVIETTRTIKMSKEQAELYKSMAKKKFVNTASGILTAQTVLEKMLRLQEISGGVVSYENPDGNPKYIKKRIGAINPKISEMMSVLEEVTGSVIVWCAYREEIEMVVEALSNEYGRGQVVEIHGGIDADTRHANVYDKFQTKRSRFLVGMATVGGVGLKMSAAETVIYYSNTFNYVDRVQSKDRTQSSDQTKSVLYVDLVCEDTVDGLILEALRNKQDVSEYVNKSIGDIHKRISLAQ